MAKKKITVELSNNEYLNFLKIIALGDFAFQGHKKANRKLYQTISSICSYAKDFNCEDLINGPNLIDGCYEIDPDFMSDLIDECLDVGEVPGEEDIRFMLKSSE